LQGKDVPYRKSDHFFFKRRAVFAMKGLNRLVSLLLAAAAVCAAQNATTYLDEPVESWRAEFPSIGIGNGVFASPSGDMVVAVASNGLVRAYQPSNGDVLW
jgi:hypothetical protein